MSRIDYSDWIGRTTERLDLIAPFPAVARRALLGRDTAPEQGDALPPGWQWLYFLETPGPAATGPDGHPRRGGFLPPIALERRMWAAGRFEMLEPLTLGVLAKKTSRIASITPKTGASGEMVFVVLEHHLEQEGRLRIREEQTLVYRAMPSAPDAPAPGPSSVAQEADWRAEGAVDPVSLFRFSALTFNGHRIHYDRPYAETVEHYPGLVVQGPYSAILLLELAARRSGRAISAFEFRATGPAFADEPLGLCGRDLGEAADLWSETPRGLGMRAKAALTKEVSHGGA